MSKKEKKIRQDQPDQPDKKEKPRALTVEEMRLRFVEEVHYAVRFWHHNSDCTDDRQRLDGLAHSILVMLDGEAAQVPGFLLIPAPHPSDKGYLKRHNENWWISQDIAGHLHERFGEFFMAKKARKPCPKLKK